MFILRRLRELSLAARCGQDTGSRNLYPQFYRLCGRWRARLTMNHVSKAKMSLPMKRRARWRGPPTRPLPCGTSCGCECEMTHVSNGTSVKYREIIHPDILRPASLPEHLFAFSLRNGFRQPGRPQELIHSKAILDDGDKKREFNFYAASLPLPLSSF